MKTAARLIALMMLPCVVMAADADNMQTSNAAESASVRVRTSDIQAWESIDAQNLLLTTRLNRQFHVTLERPCAHLEGGPRDNLLITDNTWLDNKGYIRIVDRDLLPMGTSSNGLSDTALRNARTGGTTCFVRRIEAKGKTARPQSSKDN